uniref:hypothetical protein n=1 Tax=Pseudonocardia sp. CA-138482 TaxID=3240023 RepID=UPI003F49B07C
MRIHFVITGPGGSPIVAGGEPTETDDLSAWSNHSSVVRLLRAARVAPGRGQRLTMWIEDDRPIALFPDETIDRAAEAFHDALGTHLDYAGASCSRGDDWVDAPVTAVVEALLLSGWVPPVERDDVIPAPRAAS